MTRAIEVDAPGVVRRLRKARTEKRCRRCHGVIRPGEDYWSKKCSWEPYSYPICLECA